MLPGLHNISAHFGIFFWVGAFGNVCFIPYLYIYYLKNTLPFRSVPVLSHIWMQIGRQEKPWSLGGFEPMWGQRMGCPFPGAFSPQSSLAGSGPCRTTHSKGKHFFFSSAKAVKIHWIPMPVFCLNQRWVCGMDFSFKNRAKVYLVCFAFFFPPPHSLMEQLRSLLKYDFKSQTNFSWHGKGPWCSCQNMVQVKGRGTLT